MVSVGVDPVADEHSGTDLVDVPGPDPMTTTTTSPAAELAPPPAPSAAPARPAPRPHLRIKPASGWSLLNFREIVAFRDLLWTMAGRDLKLRYRQTALGAIWVVLQPLMNAAILAFIFGRVAKLQSSFLTCFAAMLCWQMFSQVLSKSAASMIGNSQLVSKVYFPRLILPLSTALSTLIDTAVSFVVMLVLLALYGRAPGAAMLLVPVWIGLTLLLALGVGFLSSALTVQYRDVNYILPVLLQVLMLASPVGYSVDALANASPLAKQLYMLNPLASLLEAFRWSLVGEGHMQWGYVAYSAAVSIAVFFAGAFTFRRMERRFADV